MNNLLEAFLRWIFDWILFSIALSGIAKKLGWKEKWRAWVPGLRFFTLGKTIRLEKEGLFCGIIDLLYIVTYFLGFSFTEEKIDIALALLQLVLFLFLFSYQIRIFLRILVLFEQRRSWIFLWLIANWLPLLIFGFGKKYQPNMNHLRDESWQAGEKPADLAVATPGAAAAGPMPKDAEGLTVRLRERTAKDFGKKRYLLKDISLDIPKKSLVLLLGGSGSGKTTLVNAMIGYEKADADVFLNGADVYKEYDRVKHKIGFVPQKNLIRQKDTVIRTVRDAADMRLPTNVSRDEKSSRIGEVMGLLGLAAGQEGLVSKKSGGQLRRICIATELRTDPELFVLDEPDSGLDGVISREIFTKLRQIADEGRIVIVITHTPDRVIDLFDKVIVLARDSGRVGRLAFYGTPDEARAFFEKDTMEQIVMSVNGKEEGGEGRANELIEKYAAYTASKENGKTS